MRTKFSLLMLASALVSAPAAAQSVSDGIAAWRGGDPQRAVAIWMPLAQSGDADAQYNLAQAYRLGRGIRTDARRAKTLFESAAEMGHIGARTNLGLMLYSEGERVEGLGWLKGSADAGEARALLVYGTALFNGDAIDRDVVTGYALVSRAAAQDLAAAKNTLAEMDEVLDVEDRRKGVALAQRLVRGDARLIDVLAEPPVEVATARPRPQPTPAPAARPAPTPRPATPAPAAAASASSVPASAYTVQLGAFARDGAAQSLFASLRSESVFEGKQPLYREVGNVTRLRVGPFASNREAQAACAAMQRRSQPCFVVAP